MGIIPTELLMFALTIWVYVKLRKYISLIHHLAYGITVPLPLAKEEYEKYKSAKEKEGKDQNKYQKKHQSKKGARFPVKTLEVNDQYAEKVCSINFFETDFLALLFMCSVWLFLIFQILQSFTKGIKEINLAYSMEFFTAAYSIYYLFKIAMENGIWKSDEAKVALFLGAQAWIISFVLLYITPEYVDLGLPKVFETMMTRLNEALSAMDLKVDIGYEYFCGLLSTIAALITVGQTKHAVGFAHYYHTLTKNDMEKTWAKLGYNVSRFKRIKACLHIAFVLPIFLVVLYIPPLFKNYVVPAYLSNTIFELLRVLLIICYAVVKLTLARRELQWTVDQSYGYIKALPYNTNDQYYNAMTTRMLDIVNKLWTFVMGHVASVAVPVLLGILILHKGICLLCTEEMQRYDFSFLYVNATTGGASLETDHAAISNGTIPKVKVNPYAAENLAGIFNEVNNKGLVPQQFYRSTFGFVLFWWVLSYFAISIFALLYYRRFQSTAPKKKIN